MTIGGMMEDHVQGALQHKVLTVHGITIYGLFMFWYLYVRREDPYTIYPLDVRNTSLRRTTPLVLSHRCE